MSRLSVVPLFGLLLLVVAVSMSDGYFGPDWNQCLTLKLPCSFCGRRINVNLIARNELVDTKFEQRATLIQKRRRFLVDFMQDAADMNGAFNFAASYHGNLGFFVTTINGVSGSTADKTYWQIISLPSGKPLDCGVSTYLPKNGETILFNLTSYA